MLCAEFKFYGFEKFSIFLIRNYVIRNFQKILNNESYSSTLIYYSVESPTRVYIGPPPFYFILSTKMRKTLRMGLWFWTISSIAVLSRNIDVGDMKAIQINFDIKYPHSQFVNRRNIYQQLFYRDFINIFGVYKVPFR